MIPIWIYNNLFEQYDSATDSNNNRIPDDIDALANNFWDSNIVKKDRYSIKRNEINSTALSPDYQFYKGENRPETGQRYLLLKIMQIKKMEGTEIMAKNFGGWFKDNLSDFLMNDSKNAIKNADGSINYISDPKDSVIFAFKESGFIAKGGNSNSILNAVFFKGEIGKDGRIVDEFKNGIYISFELEGNFVQNVIFRPLNNLLRVLFPRNKIVLGGPSSAGVRIPPRNS